MLSSIALGTFLSPCTFQHGQVVKGNAAAVVNNNGNKNSGGTTNANTAKRSGNTNARRP